MMQCADVYRIFFKPGEVTEIRAYGLEGKGGKAWEGYARGAGIVYGYFDNAEAFGQAAEALERAKAPGIYFVLNPVTPSLLARAANRLKAADMKTATTTDKDIVCLRWIYIDLDPKRPSGISSSKEELEASVELRDRIAEWFCERQLGRCIIEAVSGNGAHVLVKLPDIMVNNEENRELVKRCLKFLAGKFDTAMVAVDQAVFNPARICKVYGTTARKGDHTEIRPHRKSYIEPACLEMRA